MKDYHSNNCTGGETGALEQRMLSFGAQDPKPDVFDFIIYFSPNTAETLIMEAQYQIIGYPNQGREARQHIFRTGRLSWTP